MNTLEIAQSLSSLGKNESESFLLNLEIFAPNVYKSFLNSMDNLLESIEEDFKDEIRSLKMEVEDLEDDKESLEDDLLKAGRKIENLKGDKPILMLDMPAGYTLPVPKNHPALF